MERISASNEPCEVIDFGVQLVLGHNLVDKPDLESFFGENKALGKEDFFGFAGVEVKVPREGGVFDDWRRNGGSESSLGRRL